MKVLICGAGIGGLALAKRMSALDNQVVLLERAPGPRSQGYMIDFFGAGYDAIDAMGLLPAIREVAYSIDEASFIDANGRRRAGLRYELFAKGLGGRLLSIMRPDLERVLRESLPSGVELRFGANVINVVDRGDRVQVTLDDGTELDADLLVGADGVHSTVRRLAFGGESQYLRYLGFHTAAYIFDDPEIHVATQGRFCLTDTIGKQMGLYGLRDGRVAVFAVHRAPEPALPADIPGTIREVYGGLGWVVPEALDRCPAPDDIYYDQVAQIEMGSWSRGRVVLVGDSCYAVSLLAGQGASLAIGGAYLLADLLHTEPSVDEALAAYERLWRPVAEEKQRAGRGAARWFLPESPLLLWMRRAALAATRLPVIRQLVVQALAGKPTAVIPSVGRHRVHQAIDG